VYSKVTRKNELAAINSQKRKKQNEFAELTTRTIARMKRLVNPHKMFLRDDPSICSTYSEKYSATQAETMAIIRRKNDASRSITKEKENSVIGWYSVKPDVSPENRTTRERAPRNSDAKIGQQSEIVLIYLLFTDTASSGTIVPARRVMIARRNSSIIIFSPR